MWLPRLKALTGFFLAAVLSAPAWGNETSVHAAVPGTLNYVEGQSEIGGEALSSKSIGSTVLQTGQSLTTEEGKAEVLLTPGVFLRVGSNSSIKMISPSLTDTEVGIAKGHAMIEVAEIHRANYIRVSEDGATTQLLKTGLYDFDQRRDQLRVFDGKAVVEDDGARVTVKGGHAISLADNGLLKSRKFDKKSYEEGDLYRWSSLRSSYLAEVNVDAARIYVANGWGPWGPGWWGAGWYWDPWFDAYTFIPADGIFYSPFGWGFYSPRWLHRSPLFGYRFDHGGDFQSYRHHFRDDHNVGLAPHHEGGRSYVNRIYRGPGSFRSGFHSGPMMAGRAHGLGDRAGGGFHGSGGSRASGFRGR